MKEYKNKKNEILKFQSNFSQPFQQIKRNGETATCSNGKVTANSIKQVQYE